MSQTLGAPELLEFSIVTEQVEQFVIGMASRAGKACINVFSVFYRNFSIFTIEHINTSFPLRIGRDIQKVICGIYHLHFLVNCLFVENHSKVNNIKDLSKYQMLKKRFCYQRTKEWFEEHK